MPLIVVLIILIILAVALWISLGLVSEQTKTYRIENQHYGFQLITPKNWVTLEKTVYSQENVDKILKQCNDDKSENNSVYEFGAYKFESQRYPIGFGDPGYPTAGLTSGTILEVTANCISKSARSKIKNSPSDVKIAGENAYVNFFDSQEFGKIKRFSIFHNNIQYNINQYIYISAADKSNEQKIKEDYASEIDKIISSFSFIK